MQICYFSDLHLEHYDFNQSFPSGDVLLLAGDICTASDLTHWKQSAEKQARRDHALWFFDEALERFRHVIYCMGNHEHIDFNFFETPAAIRQALPDQIILLDKDHVTLNNLIIYGATLWTDFENGNLQAMQNAQEKMPEYKYVSIGDKLMTPEATLRDHNLAKRNLSFLAKTNPDKQILVLTHHAPSHQGLNHTVTNNGLNGAFASNMDQFIENTPNISHWVFGHTHVQTSFTLGSCQLAANCRGYRELDRAAADFSPEAMFEIKDTAVIAA